MAGGHGDIAAARQAFKAAAIDFSEEPFDEERLVKAIMFAFDRPSDTALSLDGARLSTLSPREREVRDLLVEGLDNVAMGQALGISPRTVEVHKSRLMSKLSARNLVELMKKSIGRGGT